MALLTRAAPVAGCGTVIAVGSVDAVALAESTGADLVRVRDGRAALRALRQLTGTAMVVGPHCDEGRLRLPLSGELLACVDGSLRAEAVLPVAGAWAEGLGLDLWLLYVLSLADAAELARHRGPADVLQNGYLARAVAGLQGTAAVAGWEVLHGNPAAAVSAHARYGRAALVALNTHGASTPARCAFGRVPARLVLESPVPVLLTRTTDVPPHAPARPRPRPLPPRPRPALPPRRPAVGGDGVAAAARSFLSVADGRGATLRAPAARSLSRRTATGLTALAVILATAFTTRVPLPYHRLGGATRPASALVSITGTPVDTTAGTILVTVVTSKPVTLAGAVRAWLDRSSDVRPNQPDGPYADSVRWTNRRLMAEAGSTATVVALRHLGIDPGAVHVAVVPRGLGGPSAGLAMALELVDLLSPGDLTGGHRVAVSGALDPDGRVGPVGGVRYKAAAARRAGADVLLVPAAAAADAVAFAPGVRVVPVTTFAEALAALRSL